MKPLPQAVQDAFPCVLKRPPERPWWRPYREQFERGHMSTNDLSFPQNYAALASYDAKHPLPHPGYRAGQVWAAEDGSSVVITNTNQIAPRFREDYPYLMADPSCPWLAPWSPVEEKS